MSFKHKKATTNTIKSWVKSYNAQKQQQSDQRERKEQAIYLRKSTATRNTNWHSANKCWEQGTPDTLQPVQVTPYETTTSYLLVDCSSKYIYTRLAEGRSNGCTPFRNANTPIKKDPRLAANSDTYTRPAAYVGEEGT